MHVVAEASKLFDPKPPKQPKGEGALGPGGLDRGPRKPVPPAPLLRGAGGTGRVRASSVECPPTPHAGPGAGEGTPRISSRRPSIASRAGAHARVPHTPTPEKGRGGRPRLAPTCTARVPHRRLSDHETCKTPSRQGTYGSTVTPTTATRPHPAARRYPLCPAPAPNPLHRQRRGSGRARTRAKVRARRTTGVPVVWRDDLRPTHRGDFPPVHSS